MRPSRAEQHSIDFVRERGNASCIGDGILSPSMRLYSGRTVHLSMGTQRIKDQVQFVKKNQASISTTKASREILWCGRLQVATRMASSDTSSFVEAVRGFSISQASVLPLSCFGFHQSKAVRDDAAQNGFEVLLVSADSPLFRAVNGAVHCCITPFFRSHMYMWEICIRAIVLRQITIYLRFP